jgi:hypothetical protein
MRTLATGKGDVRDRLLGAYMSFHTLNEKDFPEEFKKDWAWVMKQLTKYGPLRDYKGDVWLGSVENTMNRIRNSTGERIAKKIFDLGWELWTNEKYL